MPQQAATTPSVERIRELLDYDPATGKFYWRKSLSGNRAGDEAGCTKRGYVIVGIDKFHRQGHRLAWAHFYGEHSPLLIDHIDQDGTNNRIDNLRLATRRQNGWNRGPNVVSTTGFKGVALLPTGRYQARCDKIHIGSFGSAIEAARAYDAAALQRHGEFACLNFAITDQGATR